MATVHTSEFHSSIGHLRIASTEKGVAYIGLPQAAGRGLQGWMRRYLPDVRCVSSENDFIREAKKQILEYLEGGRVEFDLELDLYGTEFECEVFAELARIPYGQTRSYGEVARAIGRDRAMRAVGSANGANPLPLVVPCHRVIASGQKLGGYAGGTWLKAKLLAMESQHSTTGRLL